MTTRRTFLQGNAMAVLTTLGHFTRRSTTGLCHRTTTGPAGRPWLDWFPRAGDPDLHAMAMRALDAARSAGASYADVRFTVTTRRTFVNTAPATNSETLALGVRALVNGAWGFVATTEWTADGVAKLGRAAAEQARDNVWSTVPPITLSDRPAAVTGHWQTPCKRDPFAVPADEVSALIGGAVSRAEQFRAGMRVVLTFERQDRTFASTDGAFVTQAISTSLGGSPHTDVPPSGIIVGAEAPSGKPGQYVVPSISPAGAGYEVVEAIGMVDHLSEWIEKAKLQADAKPFDALGEYDVVFDAYAMAGIVNGTFGVALEYDRAVGEEANAGGTSYLASPPRILGTSWAPKDVTITADRTMLGGAGTVQWDDEGVVPQPTVLVKDGVVVNYATNRAFATELAPWYHQHGVPVRSMGCAATESALMLPLVHTPNLALKPGAAGTTFDSLLHGIAHGYAILGGEVEMDMQQLTGRGRGAEVYTVTNGKLGAPVALAAHTFKSPTLWRNLIALGGPETAAASGLSSSKGQPNQTAVHTVNAVAGRFQNVRIQPATQV